MTVAGQKWPPVIAAVAAVAVLAVLAAMSGCDNAGLSGSDKEVDHGPYIDRTSPNIGTLKYVPGGSFQRDGEADNISEVSAFWMNQYEITRAQFFTIMGSDPSLLETSSGGTSDPVQRVNWYHAIAFSNKLSLAESLTPVYSVSGVSDWAGLAYSDIPTSSNANWNQATADWRADGYRLPFEMEWMWAAMGATQDSTAVWVDGVNTTGWDKAFAGSTGSNTIGNYAVYKGNSGPGDTDAGDPANFQGTTRPAGSKLPNELGLYDMSGNVWEWCWDWDDEYPTGPVADYLGADSGEWRILRGGGMETAEDTGAFHPGDRNAILPQRRAGNAGFRVVRSVPVVYEAGDTGPAGGIVFYDKGEYTDGWRYLEAAPASTEWANKPWGGPGTIDDGTQTGIGTGEANTLAIVAAYGDNEPLANRADYAAKLCSDLEYAPGVIFTRFTDWFLPSKDELDLMYVNLHLEGLGTFAEAWYWSSSDYGPLLAWSQFFGDGHQGGLNPDDERMVRAVRAF